MKEQQFLSNQGHGQKALDEKKLSELLSEKHKLTQIIEDLKEEREHKRAEFQQIMDHEKGNHRNKLASVEQKCRELEAHRSQMMFD